MNPKPLENYLLRFFYTKPSLDEKQEIIFLNSIARESQRVETVTTEVLDYSRRLTQRLSKPVVLCMWWC
jgi:hypothetical protein